MPADFRRRQCATLPGTEPPLLVMLGEPLWKGITPAAIPPQESLAARAAYANSTALLIIRYPKSPLESSGDAACSVAARSYPRTRKTPEPIPKPPRQHGEHGAAFLTACDRFANLETKAVEFA
jgi:hypothetical protein